jgi:hypothetical protein
MGNYLNMADEHAFWPYWNWAGATARLSGLPAHAGRQWPAMTPGSKQ